MAEYNKITAEVLEQLKAAAPGHILTGEDVNADYGRDEMPIYGESMPEAVLQATSTEEIAAVVKICNENKIPVTTTRSRSRQEALLQVLQAAASRYTAASSSRRSR